MMGGIELVDCVVSAIGQEVLASALIDPADIEAGWIGIHATHYDMHGFERRDGAALLGSRGSTQKNNRQSRRSNYGQRTPEQHGFSSLVRQRALNSPGRRRSPASTGAACSGR